MREERGASPRHVFASATKHTTSPQQLLNNSTSIARVVNTRVRTTDKGKTKSFNHSPKTHRLALHVFRVYDLQIAPFPEHFRVQESFSPGFIGQRIAKVPVATGDGNDLAIRARTCYSQPFEKLKQHITKSHRTINVRLLYRGEL